jgi:hypothetical protein
MVESSRWGLQRYLTLLGVLAVHVVLLAAIFVASRTEMVAQLIDDAVEVQFLPAPTLPKIRAENIRMRGANGNLASSTMPPMLDSAAPGAAASGSDSGSGSGVDWKAEARRAVRAYEIRTRQPPDSLLTGSPAEEHWWPRTRHYAGEQFKTPNGDWIVWIDTDCYQIASAGGNANVPGELLSPTICVSEPGKPRPNGSAATN